MRILKALLQKKTSKSFSSLRDMFQEKVLLPNMDLRAVIDPGIDFNESLLITFDGRQTTGLNFFRLRTMNS